MLQSNSAVSTKIPRPPALRSGYRMGALRVRMGEASISIRTSWTRMLFVGGSAQCLMLAFAFTLAYDAGQMSFPSDSLARCPSLVGHPSATPEA